MIAYEEITLAKPLCGGHLGLGGCEPKILTPLVVRVKRLVNEGI